MSGRMCTPGPGGQELRHSGSWWIMAGAFFVASILVQPSFVNCQKSIVAHTQVILAAIEHGLFTDAPTRKEPRLSL